MNPYHQHPLYVDHDGTDQGPDAGLLSQVDTYDEIILLRVQNHHLNSRLMDHVRIEAARTEQIANVIEENEALREELAGFAETIEIYEANARMRQHNLPRLPSVLSEGLPIRQDLSPGHMRPMYMRPVTSLGQRPHHNRASFLVPDRPHTSQGYTAPLRTRSTSTATAPRPYQHFSEAVPQAPIIDSDDTWLEPHDEAASPPPTPTLNILPPTPAPRRFTRPPVANSFPLALVLTALSDRRAQSLASRSHTSASDHSNSNSSRRETAYEKRRDVRPRTAQGLYGQSAQSHSEPLYVEPEYGNGHAEQHQSLRGLLEQFSSHDELHDTPSDWSESSAPWRCKHEGGARCCGRQGSDMVRRHTSRPQFADSSSIDNGISALVSGTLESHDTSGETDSTSDGDTDLDYQSAADVEALLDEEPTGSKRPSSSTFSEKDANMPNQQDIILHMAQMMRLERKETEDEKAQWGSEKRALLEKRQVAISSTLSTMECACLSATTSLLPEHLTDLKLTEPSGMESCDSYAPPAYDFLKPWTYPLPYQNILLDIEDRLGALQRQSAELGEEKRLFDRLARAATTWAT